MLLVNNNTDSKYNIDHEAFQALNSKETPCEGKAVEGQVNINSFTNHQLSLIPAETGNASFQHGWSWTNPLS